MKKITLLLLTMLTMTLGYSQACTETNLTASVQGTFTYGYSFSTSGTDVIITFDIVESFTGLVGQLRQGNNFSNMSSSDGKSFSTTLSGQVNGTTLSLAFFGPYAGGGVIESVAYSYTVGDTCVPIPPGEDISLSDLQLDGASISGFGSTKKTYNIELASATPIPQVTSATATNAGATVGAITQASAVPGSATFTVTSQDGTVSQLYTINFIISSPQTAAPTPPARAAADVVSIYSDAYAVIPAINLDQGWCDPNAVEATTAGGNAVLAYKNRACQGIDFDANRQDLTGFTHLHVDLFVKAGTDLVGKVFNIKTVPGAGDESILPIDLNALSPQPVPGTWYSYDMPITFSGPTTATRQVGVTSNLQNAVWYDNLYFHKNTTLSTNNFEIAGLSVYPNPSQNSWTVKTQNIKMETISVFDVLGKNVLSLTPNATETSINGSSLKSGLYFAQIKTANGVSSIKLVKK
ncbi:T9SS type A sorting domain-containing protein [Mariniflexile sp.]|uniref:T9SS type A sorting domain-containing protein n=1 Tax=Mariniflexile sp. TaxID=1979402 RepID=UPI004048E273